MAFYSAIYWNVIFLRRFQQTNLAEIINIFSTHTRKVPQKQHKTDAFQMSNAYGNPRAKTKNTVIHIQN